MIKNLKEKRDQAGGRASPAKVKQIRERAGELAMNHGKQAHEADKQEVQCAKRELLNMEITSPQG